MDGNQDGKDRKAAWVPDGIMSCYANLGLSTRGFFMKGNNESSQCLCQLGFLFFASVYIINNEFDGLFRERWRPERVEWLAQ